MTGGHAMWQAAFEFAPDGYFITDLNGVILHANRKAEELAGRGRNALAGMSCFDEALLHPAHVPRARAILDQSVRGTPAGPEEFRISAAAGKSIWIEITTRPIVIDGARLVLCIARETTRHHCYEESLRKANARLYALIDAIPDPVFFKDESGKYVMSNRAAEEATGLAGERLIGTTASDHLTGEAAAECQKSDERALRGERPIRTEEYCETRDDGRRYFDVVKSPIRDGDGELLGLVVVCRDITGRKVMEDALRKSEKFIRDILESVDEGFIVIDREHRIISANKAYLSQVRLSASEVIGRKCHAVSHASSTPCYERGEQCAVRQTFETGEPVTALHIHRDREQDAVYVEIKSYPLKDENGATIAAIEIVNNVTEKKRLEEQLRHAQKLEAVGQLAGGIAHDFNNILTAIIGYGSLLKNALDAADPLRLDAEQILSASERAANLTRGLLTFSRKQAITPYPVNVNEIIANMEKLLRRIIGEDVDIRFHPGGGEIVVMADVGHFEQVVMNLATNAKDAMPNGGRLTISTERVRLDKAFVRKHGYGKQGDYVRISVTDTGSGMDDRTRSRIYEPFFTTKAAGKGTGLGLSIVYGLVKQHGGYIICDSEPSRGTRFDIHLPLVKGEMPSADRAIPPPASGGSETILLVEDEDAVRALMKRVLERGGYEVIEAADGDEAVARFRENRERVQLLLLDVIMPKKNGKDVYAAIRRERPDIRAVFVSGYTADIVTAEGILEKGASFLSKPVSPAALLKKVREVLDGNGKEPRNAL